MATDGPEPRRRLAGLMDDRRIELDLSWEEVARRAGMVGMTLRRIRNGESALPRRTAAKIDRALKWQPGSVEGILADGEPEVIPKEDRSPDEISDEEVEDALSVMRAGLKRLYPPEEVDRRIAREREEIAEAQKARARRQRQAG